jgi:hypothetical protein
MPVLCLDDWLAKVVKVAARTSKRPILFQYMPLQWHEFSLTCSDVLYRALGPNLQVPESPGRSLLDDKAACAQTLRKLNMGSVWGSKETLRPFKTAIRAK